jgi:methionine-gamma-lyase
MTTRKKRYHKREIAGRAMRPETLMLGYGYDPMLSEGAIKPPIFQSSTFVFESAAAGKSFFELAYGKREKAPGEDPGLIYSRINNPDLEVLEDRLAIWDGAETALTFSSGMSAIATTIWTYLKPGDAIIHSEPLYGGTEFLLRKILPAFGIKRASFHAGDQDQSVASAVAELAGEARVGAIYIETPANPTSALVDIARCRALSEALTDADGRRPPVIVDNTFLGPLWQRPLDHGADIVIYSLTKYVGGHSDVIAGACSGARSWIAPISGYRTILGSMLHPFDSWLLMRSLETLKLRMTAAAENARIVAEFLRSHPKVTQVDYLDFLAADDPRRALYKRQCEAAGSTFSFIIKRGEREAFAMLDGLQHIKLAVSLGGTETLISHPATTTHSDLEPEELMRLGITPGLVRISVGVEHAEDLIADLGQALDRAP